MRISAASGGVGRRGEGISTAIDPRAAGAPPEPSSCIAARLLAWYDAEARTLPWRIPPEQIRSGRRPDPYRVWLSEIMLQQTTTVHAAPYYQSFTRRWPNVLALAAAQTEEVMAAWAGLGYYARARNLHACARQVAAAGGEFPARASELQKLPGVGPYTAGAIAAIAFGEPVAAVDGNVERVASRIFRIDRPLAASRPDLRRAVGTLVPKDRPGDFAQALMDLGSEICTPRRPRCGICPIAQDCRARAAGVQDSLPVKPARPRRPVRRGVVFLLTRNGEVVLTRRPPGGLLGGMLALPGGPWTETAPPDPPPPRGLLGGLERVGVVRHVFTHFSLELEVRRGALGEDPEAGLLLPLDRAERELPSVFRKALGYLDLAAVAAGAKASSPAAPAEPIAPTTLEAHRSPGHLRAKRSIR